MTTRGGTTAWSRSLAAAPAREPEPGTTYDVVVIGAGIVGLTAALELVRAGATVAVLEAAGGPGRGVTGQSTAKVTTGHGLTLSEVHARHGETVAGEYALAAQAGLDYVGALARPEPWCTTTAHQLYATEADSAGALARHASDALRLGLPVTSHSGSVLGFADEAQFVVRYEDQLLIDPVLYCDLLASTAGQRGAALFYGCTARAIVPGTPLEVRTAAGQTISGNQVIVATHVPFPVRSLAFALVEQRRHYAVAGLVPDEAPTSYDVGNGWSTRAWTPDSGGGRAAIVVGPGHPTGAGDETAAMHRLRTWAETRLGMTTQHSWSTQDAFTTDLLPLCGRAYGSGNSPCIATGFGAWGLTLGTAAAVDLATQIGGGSPRWPSWGPARSSLLRHPGTSLSVSARTARNLLSSVPRPGTPGDPPPLTPGQGRLEHTGGRVHAVSLDSTGAEHRVSARCTHLGCLVGWNHEAQSWDCNCHGSRFAPDGSVLHGPAVTPLAPVLPDPPASEGETG